MWDRIGGSFKNPSSFEGNGPLDYVKKMTEEKFSNHAGNGCKNEKLFNGEGKKAECEVGTLGVWGSRGNKVAQGMERLVPGRVSLRRARTPEV